MYQICLLYTSTAFQYLDISKLEPVNLKVEVKGTVTTKAEA